MKFTNQNQKWVLTLGLLAVLGFSLSAHFSPKSGPEYAQLGATQEQIEPVMLANNHKLEGVAHLSATSENKAQTEEEKKKAEAAAEAKKKEEEKNKTKKTEASVDSDKIEGSNERYGGNHIVIFQKSDDGKTLVTHPKCKSEYIETECVACNKIQRTLDKNFTKDFAELTKALNAVDNCIAKEEAKTVSPEKEKTDGEKHKEDFAKLAKECDKKSNKDDRVECNIDGLTKLLKNTKITYEKSDVVEFFDKYIKNPLKNALDSLGNYNSSWSLGGFSDYREKLYSLSEKIKTMQDEVREEYSYIRERVANVSIRAMAEKALEINNYRHSNSPDALYAESMAMGQLQMMTQLLPASNKSGLLSAVSNGFIDQRYAGNIYNSVGNYGNLVLQNLSDISNMSPYAAYRLLNTGLIGLDGLDYRRSSINTLDIGSRLQRLGMSRFDGFNDFGTSLFGDDMYYPNRNLRSSRALGRGLRSGSLFDRDYGLFDRDYDLGSRFFDRDSGLGSRFSGTRRSLRGNSSRLGLRSLSTGFDSSYDRYNDSGLFSRSHTNGRRLIPRGN